MNKGLNLLSNLTIYDKYAKYLLNQQRRESWDEIVNRSMYMFIDKYPHLKTEIMNVFNKFVRPKLVLTSMRGLQFAGRAIDLMPNRLMNCSAMPVDHYKAFREHMFLLLGGTGVGYSVQRNHIKKLPKIKRPTGSRRFVVQDSIMGWADSVDALVKSYFFGLEKPIFDFRDIRPRGTPLKTAGGKAPGPEGLMIALQNIEKILEQVSYGSHLSPLQIHDIMCHIASAVLSGGIRRAACICLFDFDDQEMINCKSGNWFDENPQRQYANNSAMTLRYKIRKKDFIEYIKRTRDNMSGEPGIYFANDHNSLCNPCVEASVNMNFCNLTTYNMSQVKSNDDLYSLASAAAFIGTLQAGFTNYHYLREIWQERTEQESLLGVSMTGLARKDLFDFDLQGAAEKVLQENERVAKLIGINPAYRSTVNKPEGSSSAVLGTSSGVHAWYSKYYIRRTTHEADSSLFKYFQENYPELTEINRNGKGLILSPCEAPDGAVLREEESAIELLERVLHLNTNWVKPGHRKGNNGHSVSATIFVKDEEWNDVTEWMWKNKDNYNGLSLFPFSDANYEQAPFESITKEEYDKMSSYIPEKGVDLSEIKEYDDNTDRKGEVACAGASCEIS